MTTVTNRWPALIVVVLALVASPARAADANQVDRAKKYLSDEKRAKAMLFFMHPTAEYSTLSLVRQTGVINTLTRLEKPGWFCLQYRFKWKSGLFNDYHTTDLLAFFNDKGRLDELQAGTTTTFVKPFTASNVVIAAVKDALLENAKNDPNRLRVLRALIEKADARGLLTFLLQVEQK